MKATTFSLAISLVPLFTHVVADIVLGSFPGVVYVGHDYTLNWTGTPDYTYNIWLVTQIPSQTLHRWTNVVELAAGLHPISSDASYTWTVPSNISTPGSYALSISGSYITTKYSGGNEANITHLFSIANPSSPTSASSGAASTASSPTTGTSSGRASSATPVGNSNSAHATSISGGAIAGIVVGCVVLVAMVIGAVLFFGWRRKRLARQKREADLRANRLAPVMQEGSGAFEMQGRPPQPIQDVNT